jgi:hypothetical protein
VEKDWEFYGFHDAASMEMLTLQRAAARRAQSSGSLLD